MIFALTFLGEGFHPARNQTNKLPVPCHCVVKISNRDEADWLRFSACWLQLPTLYGCPALYV